MLYCLPIDIQHWHSICLSIGCILHRILRVKMDYCPSLILHRRNSLLMKLWIELRKECCRRYCYYCYYCYCLLFRWNHFMDNSKRFDLKRNSSMNPSKYCTKNLILYNCTSFLNLNSIKYYLLLCNIIQAKAIHSNL